MKKNEMTKTSVTLICLGCERSFLMYKYREKTAKYCSMKCLKLFKRICINGHDTFICGRNKNGGSCKECGRERNKKRREALRRGIKFPIKNKYCVHGHNKDKVGRNKEGACLECCKIRKQKYYKDHKKVILKKNKKRYKTYKKQIRLRGIEYRRKHKKEIQKRTKKYQKSHRKQIAVRLKIKRKNNLEYRLQVYLRARINIAIRNKQKVGSAIEDLGCSIAFFKKYISKKFYGKMSWLNYGKYWHLDHKIALYKFNLSDREQFLKACNYTNFQPLTIPDHVKKSAKETRKRNLDKSR